MEAPMEVPMEVSERSAVTAWMWEEKKGTQRQDQEREKRIELHLRTGMSSADGIASAAQYISRAAMWGHTAIAVTDFGVVQSFPDAFREASLWDIQLIPGCEVFMLPAEDSPVEDGYSVMILAVSRTGMIHLHQLITRSHAQCHKGFPCMTREWIRTHRDGLLIGSACEDGEIARNMHEGMMSEALLRTAAFYDYLELEPVENETDDLQEQEQLRRQARDMTELGRKAGIPVAAVSNARYLDPEDAVCRAVIRYSSGLLDAESQRPYYLRTTSEMLAAFRFLGEDTAGEIVIHAPQRIAAQVDRHMTLLPDGGRAFPVMLDAKSRITEKALGQAH